MAKLLQLHHFFEDLQLFYGKVKHQNWTAGWAPRHHQALLSNDFANFKGSVALQG